MFHTTTERRSRRSQAPEEALHHLLTVQRDRGELDAIALVDCDGLLLAFDGPREECEELAAYAPMLARGLPVAIEPSRLRGVRVHAFLAGPTELVLILRGGATESLAASLALHSMQSVTRILAS